MVRKTLEEVRRDAKARPREKLPEWAEEQIRKAAESDPDNPPLTEDDLKRFKPWREREKSRTKQLSEDGRKFDDKK